MEDVVDPLEQARRKAIGSVSVTRQELLDIIYSLSIRSEREVHMTWARFWKLT